MPGIVTNRAMHDRWAVMHAANAAGNGPDQRYVDQMASLVGDGSCTAADIHRLWSLVTGRSWNKFIKKNSLNIAMLSNTRFRRMQDAVLDRFSA